MIQWIFTKEHREKRQKEREARPNTSKYKSVLIENNGFTVNGKKLEPGTPEYDKAWKIFKDGMTTFDSGMETFDKAMKDLNKTMKDTFK